MNAPENHLRGRSLFPLKVRSDADIKGVPNIKEQNYDKPLTQVEHPQDASAK